MSHQLGAVSSKLREEIDKAVAVAMNTLQRTMDVRHGDGDLASLLKRLDVLEATVTAEQEMSLTTLETIMRATQRPRDSGSSVSVAMDPAGGTPVSKVGASPHVGSGSSTGILSVSVTR